MAAAAQENPAVGRSALLLAEGFAVDPELTDPTRVLGAAFADLAAPLIADGVTVQRLPRCVSTSADYSASRGGGGGGTGYTFDAGGLRPAPGSGSAGEEALQLARGYGMEVFSGSGHCAGEA
jgi:hypothetical protein